MKEAIKKIIDFCKENKGVRGLINDIIILVLSLTIPTVATVVGVALHLTWLIILAAVLYFVFTLVLISKLVFCLYVMVEAMEEFGDIVYEDDDEEDTTETKIVLRIGDRVRAMRDGIFYRKGDEGFVKNVDDPTPNGWGSIEVSFIDPRFERLAPTWVNGEDFELSNHKEDA